MKKLYIDDKCNYRKKLKSGFYEFLDDDYIAALNDDDSINTFYGKNIEISVIVGKNGSGKSSLLEIIFRMMNNLSAYIAHGVNIDSSTNIVFVGGIYADLYYSIDKNNYILKSRNKSLALVCGENNWIFGNRLNEFSGYTDGNRMSPDQKKEICKNLFFTLISNYSIQSYIEADYADEVTYNIIKKGSLSNKKSGQVWLHSVFHKNDGYLTAININPFRDKGMIDMFREEKLERQRMQALLLHFHSKDKDFIKGYKLSRIEYKFNWKSLYNKLRGNLTRKSKEAIWDIIVGKHEDALSFDEFNWEEVYDIFKRNEDSSLTEEEEKVEWDDILKRFNSVLAQKSSIAKSILTGLGVWVENNNNKWLKYTYFYVVYKVLSIVNKYPSYREKNVFNLNLNHFFSTGTEEERIEAFKLSQTVNMDHSHITNKICQAKIFKKKVQQGFQCDESTSFTMTNYMDIEIVDELNSSLALENEIRCLPPSFFEYNIYLRKDDSEEEFPIENMSAGERQLYYIISTLVYHILNIKSVKENRVRYENIAIVLDEVELGFHPEYQRKFISFLIETFERLNLSEYLGIHFLITTHSPFMLSDLRKSNILYIEDGKKIDKEDMLNPFGANINDILAQSFFLRNGFVGEFACKKILSLLDWLEGEENTNEEWNMVKAEEVVKSVGEPIIQNHLQNMVERKKEQLNNEKDINK
ncbi:AAA family ATPase [Prevotella melaninogenica]